MIKKIGFIGTGLMGLPMAKNILKSGYNLKAFNRTQNKAEPLKEFGGEIAETIKDVVKDNEVIITMLTDDNAINEVMSSSDFLDNLNPGTTVIDMSSIKPATAIKYGNKLKSYNINYLDAPVSGGIVGADNGTLTFMVGGSEENFNMAVPILNSMGKNIIHAGELGSGLAVKICNNMILGTTMIALAESFTMAKKLGLDQKTFFDISSKATGMSWAMLNHLPVANIIETASANNNFKPGFAAEMMLKDLSLAQTAANSINLSTPIGSLALNMYKEFIKNDLVRF